MRTLEATERELLERGETRAEPEVERLHSMAMRHRLTRMGLRLARSIATNDLSGVSAEMAYRSVFAFLPLLLIVVAVLQVVQQFAPGSDLAGGLIGLLSNLLPASVVEPIRTVIRQAPRQTALGLGLGGLVGAAWGTSGAASALMKGINRAYGIDFERPWWKRQLLAAGATIGIPVIGVGAVIVYLLSGALARTLGLQLGAERSVLLFWHDLRRPLLALALLAGFWILYRVLPHVRQRWLQALPGALVATAGWLVLAQAFALYLGFSHGISVAVASIGLGIVVLLWFYFLGIITLLGAEVNAAVRAEISRARTRAPGGRGSGDAR